MAGIRIVSESPVKATSHKEPTERIQLTPWDLKLFLVGPIQRGILFLKPRPPKLQTFNETFVQHLKTSLSHTLDFFSPLSGRLTIIEHQDSFTASVLIDCNNSGAQFIHAVADDVTVADILQPIYVPKIVHSFFPLNGVSNYEGVSNPLLAVQVTELVDGFFIGCAMNHSVADGTTFWDFFNSWSELSRGLDHISKTVVFKRSFTVGSSVRIPLSSIKLANEKSIPPPLQERYFLFTKEKIAGLKAKANAEAGTNKISSLQAILANLCRAVLRSRRLGPDEETNYRLAVGARTRWQPQLPESYFGNAIVAGSLTLKARDVLDNGLGYVALQMHKMIGTLTEEKMKEMWKSWTENPQMLTMSLAAGNNALFTGGSPRFDVYGNDFGWGRPVAVRSGGANKLDGTFTVFPGAEEGSIEIEACLSPETLQALGSDSEFMDAVAV